MTSLRLAEKRCGVCGEVKPLSEFHRGSEARDGRHYCCKPCAIEAANKSKARRRAAMGEEAWRAYSRRIVAKSRAKTGNRRGAQSNRVYIAALGTLRDLHRDEFDAILHRLRYEAGLA